MRKVRMPTTGYRLPDAGSVALLEDLEVDYRDDYHYRRYDDGHGGGGTEVVAHEALVVDLYHNRGGSASALGQGRSTARHEERLAEQVERGNDRGCDDKEQHGPQHGHGDAPERLHRRGSVDGSCFIQILW